jgi:hypothetical protein
VVNEQTHTPQKTMFTWTPLYKELAKTLLPFRNHQPDLVAILNDIENAGIPMIRLIDAPNPATEPLLRTIDPFTFFASFNRGLKDENRIAILKILKEKFNLAAPAPSDFNGIPVVDNMKSWFFPYSSRRDSEDIPSLWSLAESAVTKSPEQLDAKLFDRCLEIDTVAIAKLTMGLFWLNPDKYLALDGKNTAYFQSSGITAAASDHSTYVALLQQVCEKLGTDFAQISRRAWESGTSTQYWAGGSQWGEKNKVGDFTNGNWWGIGWEKDAPNPAAKKTWKYFQEVKVGDELAIKGYGGRNDLKVYYVGRITKKNEDGSVQLAKLDRPLFHDKGPHGLTGASWFDTLIPVRNPAVIDALFGRGKAAAPKPVIAAACATMPLNIILYGPPGTGKTYRLRNEYMERFTDRQAVLSPEEQASALVKDLAWWEVIALALLDTKEHKTSVAQILEHPLVQARLKLSANKNPRAMLWASLQSHTKKDCPTVNYATRIDPLLFSKDEDSLWSVDAKLAEVEVPELSETLQQFRDPATQVPEVCRYKFTTFHQSFSYEDFVEGIKPQSDGGQLSYEVRDGIFKKACREAAANPDKPYALFIDEINRGNVASILGELITLIEDDKRVGAENALTPELPYSRQPFGVPKNLHIIGTMNTADRSVEALDTALRRRFTFIEMRPDPSCIEQPASLTVDLRKILIAMNARIEQLLDHDHCIGHAYFMSVKDLAGLRSVFANRIMPLLREYFYGSPAKVGMVLGEAFIRRQSSKTPFAPGSWGAGELDEKEVYTFADVRQLTEADFQTIYGEAHSSI